MRHPLLLIVVVALTLAAPALAQDAKSLVQQGRAMLKDGKPDEALRLFRQALKTSPESFDALLAIGTTLDLQGQYAEARAYLSRAIDHAPAGPPRNQALTAMSVSYAFEAKAAEAVKFLMPVYRQQLFQKDYGGVAATANAIGRIYLESGDTANARKWYQIGHDHAKLITDLSPAERDLWELRWLHAEARVAAREHRADDARRHVSAFEQVMQRRGKQTEDGNIYRYLLGYVAYHGRDYEQAAAELAKGDLNDPFILSLLALTYEAKGEPAIAQKYFARAKESNAHTLNTAFARQVAAKK